MHEVDDHKWFIHSKDSDTQLDRNKIQASIITLISSPSPSPSPSYSGMRLDTVNILGGDGARLHHPHTRRELAPVRPCGLSPGPGSLLSILPLLNLLRGKVERLDRLGLHYEAPLDRQHLHHRLVRRVVLQADELVLIACPAVELLLVLVEGLWDELLGTAVALQALGVEGSPVRGHVGLCSVDRPLAGGALGGGGRGRPTHTLL